MYYIFDFIRGMYKNLIVPGIMTILFFIALVNAIFLEFLVSGILISSFLLVIFLTIDILIIITAYGEFKEFNFSGYDFKFMGKTIISNNLIYKDGDKKIELGFYTPVDQDMLFMSLYRIMKKMSERC